MHIVDVQVKLTVAEPSEKSRNTQHVERLKAQGWKLKAMATGGAGQRVYPDGMRFAVIIMNLFGWIGFN